MFLSKGNLNSVLNTTETLEQRCPILLCWITDKKKMEINGHLKRRETQSATGRKGSKLENSLEFTLRALSDAGIKKDNYPYLHEIRSTNKTLAKALDVYASRNNINLKDYFPVLDRTDYTIVV